MAAGGHDGDEMMFEFALISPLFTLRRPLLPFLCLF